MIVLHAVHTDYYYQCESGSHEASSELSRFHLFFTMLFANARRRIVRKLHTIVRRINEREREKRANIDRLIIVSNFNLCFPLITCYMHSFD